MSSTRHVRKHIQSLKSMRKITRAMKLVAAAKLHRLQQRIGEVRPYAVKVQEILSDLLSVSIEDAQDPAQPIHPLLVRRPLKTLACVLFTSDRGLCGGFNVNLMRTVEQLHADASTAGVEVRYFAIGRKGADALRRAGKIVEEQFLGVWEHVEMAQARRILTRVLDPFRAEEIDAIQLVFTQFKTVLTQQVVIDPLIPVEHTDQLGEAFGRHPSVRVETHVNRQYSREEPRLEPTRYLFEPEKTSVLDRLVTMYLEMSVYRAICDSQASEYAARMTAMENATQSADDLIRENLLKFNMARQAAITKEISEIVGASEAQKK